MSKYIKNRITEGPNSSGYYTASIDARIESWRGIPEWHLNAIECHSKSKKIAERRRDIIFEALMAAEGEEK